MHIAPAMPNLHARPPLRSPLSTAENSRRSVLRRNVAALQYLVEDPDLLEGGAAFDSRMYANAER